MPIFCSNLPNDQDLIKALGSVAIPCPLFTDIGFWGVGDNNSTLSIGIERKKIGDICQCMNDGRLLFQAQNAKSEGIDILIVIAEGRVRPNPDDGLLEIPVWGINPRTMKRAEIWTPVRPATQYSRFDQYLTELWRDAGIMSKRTEGVKETAAVIKALWDNYQRTDHQSLKTLFKRPPPTISFVQPNIVRRVANELKGVGWGRSKDIADKFQSVSEMVGAGEKDWMSVPGIGKKLARSIVSELKGT